MTDRIREFTNDGFTFPVTDEGPLDGDVVVLLHGFPQTSKSWERGVRAAATSRLPDAEVRPAGLRARRPGRGAVAPTG